MTCAPWQPDGSLTWHWAARPSATRPGSRLISPQRQEMSDDDDDVNYDCPADAAGLLAWAETRFPHVESMEGFVIMASDEPNVEAAFETCAARFRWLIYDPGTGQPRSADICRGLREVRLCHCDAAVAAPLLG